MREETVPLLREIKTTVEKTNAEIDRIDTVLVSAGNVVGRVEKVSSLIEEAASGPLMKIISIGAGLGKAVKKASGKSGKG
jgi:hypothetical protein